MDFKMMDESAAPVITFKRDRSAFLGLVGGQPFVYLFTGSTSDVSENLVKNVCTLFYFSSNSLLTSKLEHHKAISIARGYGIPVCFDMNLDMGMWPSKEDAHEAVKGLWEKTDIFLMTKKDFMFLTKLQYDDSDSSNTSSVKSLLGLSEKQAVIITDGLNGPIYHTQGFEGSIYCSRESYNADVFASTFIGQVVSQRDILKDECALRKGLSFSHLCSVLEMKHGRLPTITEAAEFVTKEVHETAEAFNEAKSQVLERNFSGAKRLVPYFMKWEPQKAKLVNKAIEIMTVKACTINPETEQPEVDYYHVLGLKQSAEAEEIKAAYKKLCALLRPTEHGSEFLVEAYQILCEAYSVLRDKKSRGLYDERRELALARLNVSADRWESTARHTPRTAPRKKLELSN